MPADDKIMEAVLRIEHKVDLVLDLVVQAMKVKVLPQVGEYAHTCPLCSEPVRYTVDVKDAVVLRQCGCKTGKIALDIGAFAPPVIPTRKRDEDARDDDEEDRNNPRSRRGSGRR